MPLVTLPSGATLPSIGLGTWRLGESPSRHGAEVKAVRQAIEMGYRLIDTAEMYGDGGSETVVGEALAATLRAGDVRREELFIVSKVLPHNASRQGTAQAFDSTRQRLGLDRIDLYLLHWRGPHPLRDTVAALQALVDAGTLGQWGVSNFDVDDMEELMPWSSQGSGCATNQVYYSVSERGPEYALLPWLQSRGMPLMAYSPIDQGSLAGDGVLAEIGQQRGVTAAQAALAWLTSQEGVVAIPKSVDAAHLRENLDAAEIVLSAEERLAIDQRHPRPRRKHPLAMI